ncbi:MAG: hypothetical protein WBE68_22170 [Candidatus Nitrosopolaris sp.]
MVVVLEIIGERLIRENWCVVQSYNGKGKRHGCQEPVKTVTKRKPHVFEIQSDISLR